ncbi:dead end protein 1-like [Anopheles funestus]|uniref:dead end protein 1-like n=1 Tax=Anopheles funestus TaxID=62324 RepID=UPI0020C6A90D|nr:dead end protein 1-like [Anopheles funestus]
MPINWLNQEFLVHYINGQCIIRLSSNMQETQRAVEIFVRGIPKNFGPNELVPVFSGAGLIRSIRLLMDFRQRNRGFAYVSYVNPKNVPRALTLYNGMSIAVNHKLALFRCREARTLYIYRISDVFTGYTLSQTIKHIVYVQNFESQVFHNGRYLVGMLTFTSHRDYLQAYIKIKRMRHVFGSSCWLMPMARQ